MLARAYLIFLGPLLIVMAIAGYMAPQLFGAAGLGNTTPTVWLLGGIVALALGLLMRSVPGLRWTAGIYGVIFLIWGILAMFSVSTDPLLDLRDLLGLVHVTLGSVGLATALAPAYWIREREVYSPGTT